MLVLKVIFWIYFLNVIYSMYEISYKEYPKIISKKVSLKHDVIFLIIYAFFSLSMFNSIWGS